MTSETNVTGIGEMKNGEIGEDAQVAAIIGALEKITGEKVTVTGIGKMEGGRIGGSAKVAGIISETKDIKQPNLSEEAVEEIKKKIEGNPNFKERLISAFKNGGLAEIKKLPGGEIVAAMIEVWLHPKPIFEQKDK